MVMKQVFLEKGKAVNEQSVDHLERLLRSKFELKTGFAEAGQLARNMHKTLRALDVNDNENLDLGRFVTLMKKLNCGEDRAAVEALFHRYDTTDCGIVTMTFFANATFGIKTVARSSSECREVIKQVRDLLLARGENGYRGLARVLRHIDGNGRRKLLPRELADGLATYGVRLSSQEQGTIFKYFDTDNDGRISVTEFLVGLRPTVSPARLALVKLAFLRLDKGKSRDGNVTLDGLASLYRAERHPSVLDGSKTPMEVLVEFNDAWDKTGDDIVTEEEFIDYYKDLSAAIDNDQYFELMLRNSWHIDGAEGAASTASNLRVLVTHMDGTQSVETIIDDVGLPDKKPATLAAALRKQGATDILRVELASAR
jgi:Ca2+-binding EF-hand superfamily protein